MYDVIEGAHTHWRSPTHRHTHAHTTAIIQPEKLDIACTHTSTHHQNILMSVTIVDPLARMRAPIPFRARSHSSQSAVLCIAQQLNTVHIIIFFFVSSLTWHRTSGVCCACVRVNVTHTHEDAYSRSWNTLILTALYKRMMNTRTCRCSGGRVGE